VANFQNVKSVKAWPVAMRLSNWIPRYYLERISCNGQSAFEVRHVIREHEVYAALGFSACCFSSIRFRRWYFVHGFGAVWVRVSFSSMQQVRYASSFDNTTNFCLNVNPDESKSNRMRSSIESHAK
jgi:hypothetical protein